MERMRKVPRMPRPNSHMQANKMCFGMVWKQVLECIPWERE